MKVTVDIDLTPEEARTMLGLSDMLPMQESVIKKLEEKTLETLPCACFIQSNLT